MIISHRRGCNGTTPQRRSRNIANNTFSEAWLQKSYESQGLRTSPATHGAKNTANSAFSWGGVVANREPGSYMKYLFTSIYANKYISTFRKCLRISDIAAAGFEILFFPFIFGKTHPVQEHKSSQRLNLREISAIQVKNMTSE